MRVRRLLPERVSGEEATVAGVVAVTELADGGHEEHLSSSVVAGERACAMYELRTAGAGGALESSVGREVLRLRRCMVMLIVSTVLEEGMCFLSFIPRAGDR